MLLGADLAGQAMALAPADKPRHLLGPGSCPISCSRRSCSSRSFSSTGRPLQALWQSFLVQDAFGLSTEFVWFENYVELFRSPDYYHAIGVTFMFSRHRGLLVAFACALARHDGGSTDQGRAGLPHLADLPYAVAPAVASVLFIFMFQPGLGLFARVSASDRASTGTRSSTARKR